MTRVLVLLSLVLSVQGAGSQTRADAAFYTVSYVEVTPSARTAAVAALKQYRDATRLVEGYVRFELYEQVGRAGHFSIVEAWRDQAAFDARAAAARKPLLDGLQPLRVSDFDQRPYKPLAVGPAPAAPSGRLISVVTHVDVSPDPRVAMLLTRLAEASRQDQGNIRFDVIQHAMRANHFTVIETWQDEKALDAHIAAAHTRQYRDELGPFLGSPLDERVFKAIE
jgi:quinol monooxygenase YgiN